MLAVAAGISILLGERGDALIIGVVVGLNACVGVLQEGKAKKALDSLKELASPRALVCRDGEKRMVEAWELVPGDVVFLEAGCQVPGGSEADRDRESKNRGGSPYRRSLSG